MCDFMRITHLVSLQTGKHLYSSGLSYRTEGRNVCYRPTACKKIIRQVAGQVLQLLTNLGFLKALRLEIVHWLTSNRSRYQKKRFVGETKINSKGLCISSQSKPDSLLKLLAVHSVRRCSQYKGLHLKGRSKSDTCR